METYDAHDVEMEVEEVAPSPTSMTAMRVDMCSTGDTEGWLRRLTVTQCCGGVNKMDGPVLVIDRLLSDAELLKDRWFAIAAECHRDLVGDEQMRKEGRQVDKELMDARISVEDASIKNDEVRVHRDLAVGRVNELVGARAALQLEMEEERDRLIGKHVARMTNTEEGNVVLAKEVRMMGKHEEFIRPSSVA